MEKVSEKDKQTYFIYPVFRIAGGKAAKERGTVTSRQSRSTSWSRAAAPAARRSKLTSVQRSNSSPPPAAAGNTAPEISGNWRQSPSGIALSNRILVACGVSIPTTITATRTAVRSQTEPEVPQRPAEHGARRRPPTERRTDRKG